MEAERLYTKQPSRTIQQKRGGEGALEMVDNRPAGILQAMSEHPIQRVEDDEDTLQGKFSQPIQLMEDDEEAVQGKFEAPVQKKNLTGMPDNLKAGIEDLSGFSMDDVRVHYGSSKPAAVQAHAYTQGTDIHIAPGQERHLPHEAWHVVQQMAGRVQPTTEIGGMPVNDNAALEHEADVMGARANSLIQMSREKISKNIIPSNNSIQLQSCINYKVKEYGFTDREDKRQRVTVGEIASAHLECMDPLVGSAPNPATHYELMQSIKKFQNKGYVRGHLMNDHLGGIGEYYNLFPISYKANSEHKHTAEAWAKQALRDEYSYGKAHNLNPKDCYVDYTVQAISDSDDLSKNPSVDFVCYVRRAHGSDHSSTISSRTLGYGESKITGNKICNVHYSKDWSSNSNLYGWGASGQGESIQTDKSKSRSNFWNTGYEFVPQMSVLNVEALRDAAIEFLQETDIDDDTLTVLTDSLNDALSVDEIYRIMNG